MGVLDIFQTGEKTEQAISPLKDPFTADCIEEIDIYIKKHPWFNGPPVRVYVKFQNGKTEGKQDFEGRDLQATMKEVQAFIDSLKKEQSNETG